MTNILSLSLFLYAFYEPIFDYSQLNNIKILFKTENCETDLENEYNERLACPNLYCDTLFRS